MANGLRRATLAAIKTNAWRVEGASLTGPEVVAAYEALPNKEDFLRVLGCTFMSDRKVDRTLSILKRSNLIRYERGVGWAHTDKNKDG